MRGLWAKVRSKTSNRSHADRVGVAAIRKKKMPRLTKVSIALLAILTWPSLVENSHAAEIQVFQESAPGLGDFEAHPLGRFEASVTGKDAAELYRYRGSKSQGDFDLTRDRSHLFFIESKEGLVLVVIYDDGKGGNRGGKSGLVIEFARTRSLDFQGIMPRVLVEDEPERGGDQYLIEDKRISMQHRWISGYTDGVVIGPFVGSGFIVDVKFSPIDARSPAIAGLESWAVTTLAPNLSPIMLTLAEGLRARFVITAP